MANDFVYSCLQLTGDLRPSAWQLLKHPWITVSQTTLEPYHTELWATVRSPTHPSTHPPHPFSFLQAVARPPSSQDFTTPDRRGSLMARLGEQNAYMHNHQVGPVGPSVRNKWSGGHSEKYGEEKGRADIRFTQSALSLSPDHPQPPHPRSEQRGRHRRDTARPALRLRYGRLRRRRKRRLPGLGPPPAELLPGRAFAPHPERRRGTVQVC